MVSRKNILVVEPEPKAAEKLSKLLYRQGFSARITQRGVEAIRSIQSEHVSVLILDVAVQDMPWDEIVAIVKGLNAGLPIIMTSTENTPELEASILKRNVFYYHVKSFGNEDLMLAVHNAAERSGVKKTPV